MPGFSYNGTITLSSSVSDLDASIAWFKDVLGFEVVATEGSRTRLAVGGNEPGKMIDVVERRDGPWGRHGLGGLHHIALRRKRRGSSRNWAAASRASPPCCFRRGSPAPERSRCFAPTGRYRLLP